jgi:hypothetical protein
VHTYRGQFTDKTLARVSRSAAETQNVVDNYDMDSSLSKMKGVHKDRDRTADIHSLAKQLVDVGNVYANIPGRHHSAFPAFVQNPLQKLDMSLVKDWIGDCFKQYGRKNYYYRSTVIIVLASMALMYQCSAPHINFVFCHQCFICSA